MAKMMPSSGDAYAVLHLDEKPRRVTCGHPHLPDDPACYRTVAPVLVIIAVWVWRGAVTIAIIYHAVEHRRLAEAPEMSWWEYVGSKTAEFWAEYLRLIARLGAN